MEKVQLLTPPPKITDKGGGSDGAVEKLVRAIVVRYGLTVDEAKEIIAMTLVVFGNNMTLKELVGLLGKYKIKGANLEDE